MGRPYNPKHQRKLQKLSEQPEYSEDWQSEQRATAISQNGNEGSHYFLIDQANGEKNLQSEKNDLTDEPITSDINCSNIMI